VKKLIIPGLIMVALGVAGCAGKAPFLGKAPAPLPAPPVYYPAPPPPPPPAQAIIRGERG
jgi:hypothetical protein